MSEDLIRRSDAIDALCDGCGWRESQCDKDKGFWCESGALIRQTIPTIEPKQGEWIALDERDVSGYWKCSACGTPTQAFGAKAIYKYCPFCGADMRGRVMSEDLITNTKWKFIPEREREALMRLTMCAREECSMCKYQGECNFDFQYELATTNMNILADALRAEQTEAQTEEDVLREQVRAFMGIVEQMERGE